MVRFWVRCAIAPLLLIGSMALAGDSGAFLLAEMCATCHGVEGRSQGSVPSLVSLDGEALRLLLLDFRSGEMDSTIMGRIAPALTDSEIEQLAQYFDSIVD